MDNFFQVFEGDIRLYLGNHSGLQKAWIWQLHWCAYPTLKTCQELLPALWQQSDYMEQKGQESQQNCQMDAIFQTKWLQFFIFLFLIKNFTSLRFKDHLDSVAKVAVITAIGFDRQIDLDIVGKAMETNYYGKVWKNLCFLKIISKSNKWIKTFQKWMGLQKRDNPLESGMNKSKLNHWYKHTAQVKKKQKKVIFLRYLSWHLG